MKQKLTILFLIFSLFLPLAFAQAGTILSTHKYAWSDNVGYINFENVIVGDTALSGYAWSTNTGFIKLNPSLGGVLNDGNGHLSGSAWGEGLGYIDFSGVSINTNTGRFSGTATGTLVGTLTFDCPIYCDVQTDWRPFSASNIPSGGGGGGGAPIIPPRADSLNTPLTVFPKQFGSFTQHTKDGLVLLQIPVNSLPSKTVFYINAEPLVSANKYLVFSNTTLVNNAFYNIFAKDQNGDSINLFTNPITITLPISSKFQNIKNLAVYYLNDTNGQWVLIPEARFYKKSVVFEINQLSKFAIFKFKNTKLKIPASLSLTTLPSLSKGHAVNKENNQILQKNTIPVQSIKKSFFRRAVDFLESVLNKIIEILQ